MFEVPEGIDPSKRPKTRKQRKIPRSGTPATIKAVIGLLWIVLFLQFSKLYNNSLVLGDQFMQYGFLRRVWQLEMLGFSNRMKYYGVWSLTEGAVILSGLGYKSVDPKTGKVDWNRLQNVNPFGVELAQNSRAYLENWNINTNHWLRNYMYLRVTPKGKKPGFRASLATFVTSAFWHGFYPGYYLSFVLAAFIQTIAKSKPLRNLIEYQGVHPCLPPMLVPADFRRHVRPFFLTLEGKPTTNKKYYDIFSFLVTQTAFSFTTIPFVLLTLPDSLFVWSRVYFYTIIGTVATIGFFSSPGKKWLIKQLEARNKQLQQKQRPTTERRPTTEVPGRTFGPGLPDDLEMEVTEAMQEIKEDVATRRRNGSTTKMPNGGELKAAVEAKLGKKLE